MEKENSVPAQSELVQRLRQAAAQGDSEAQFNLGRVYDNGEGVAKDLAEAVKWYRLASEQGLAEAQSALAEIEMK